MQFTLFISAWMQQNRVFTSLPHTCPLTHKTLKLNIRQKCHLGLRKKYSYLEMRCEVTLCAWIRLFGAMFKLIGRYIDVPYFSHAINKLYQILLNAMYALTKYTSPDVYEYKPFRNRVDHNSFYLSSQACYAHGMG